MVSLLGAPYPQCKPATWGLTALPRWRGILLTMLLGLLAAGHQQALTPSYFGRPPEATSPLALAATTHPRLSPLFDKPSQEPIHLGKITEDGFELYGHKYSRKARVGQVGRLSAPGTQVRIAFLGPGPRDNPIILGNKATDTNKAKIHAFRAIALAGLWGNPFGGSVLGLFAPNSYAPDPQATLQTVWSGSLGQTRTPVLLDKDGRPVLWLIERNGLNTNWVKVRCVVVTGTTTEIVAESDWIGSDAALDMLFAAVNSDASLAILGLLATVGSTSSEQIWRKRGDVVAKLTLSGLDSIHGLSNCNFSDSGYLAFPNYSKVYSSGSVVYNRPPGSTGEAAYPGNLVSIDYGAAVDPSSIQIYGLDVEGTTLTAVRFDPAALFADLVNATVKSYQGRAPIDAQGRLILWASGSEPFALTGTGFDRAACVGFNPALVTFTPPSTHTHPNNSRSWSRKLRAVVAAISGSGAKVWQHNIERTPAEPIANSQLIDPFVTAFATQTADNRFTRDNDAAVATAGPLQDPSWRPYPVITWGGIAADNSLKTSQGSYPGFELGEPTIAFSSNSVGIQGEYDPEDPFTIIGVRSFGGIFTYPQYDHWHNIGIELLPRGRNQIAATQHPADSSKWLNWDVFADWLLPTAQNGGSPIVRSSDGSVYVAYAAPRQCYFGGVSTLTGSAGGEVTGFQNILPYAFTKIEYDRYDSTYWVTPAEGDPYLFVPDYETYPLWITPSSGGGAAYYGLGVGTAFHSGPRGTVTGHFVRSMSYLAQRYLRKIDANGALVWERDMTQMVAGASFWKVSSDLGLLPVSSDLIGAVSTEELPLGDDMGPPRPCGRVVFQWVDFHSEGPNHPPTQKLCVYNDANGALLHVIELGPTDLLEEDVVEPGPPITGTATGTTDGGDTLTLPEAAVALVSVVVNGNLIEGATVSGDTVTLPTTPDPDLEWEVVYVTGYEEGTVTYRAGTRRFDPVVSEIYVGVTPASLEWAEVLTVIADRLEGGSYTRVWRVKMGADVNVLPSVEQIAFAGQPQQGLAAVAGGSFYAISHSGNNALLQRTNPSTT